MKIDMRRIATWGLYLSIIAAFTAAGLYVVFQKFNLSIQISLGIVVLGIAAFIILDPKRFRELFTGRQAKYGSNATVLIIAILGIVVVINYLVYKNPYRWDLTEDKEHTLAPESINTLQSLKEPVTVKAFYSSQYPADSAKILLENYKYNSQGKFDFQFIDPVKDVITAKNYNITRDGTIVVQMGDRTEQITYASEEELTAAIIRLANPGERVLYFLQGHGEYDPESSGEDSISQLKQLLVSKNYQINPINLLAIPNIPDDALAIIIVEPKSKLRDQEVILLKDYLSAGGSVVLFSGSPFLYQDDGSTNPFALYLEQMWGIALGDNLIIDPSINPATVTIVNEYGSHPITNKIDTTMAAVLPFARSVSIGTPPASVNPVPLAKTASGAWAESDITSIESQQISANADTDILGPVSLAIAADDYDTKGRVVVIGSSLFVTDAQIQTLGNSDLAINSIDWAAEQEGLISLTPKPNTSRYVVPPSNIVLGLILLGTIFLLPGTVIVAGIVTWIQRRRKG